MLTNIWGLTNETNTAMKLLYSQVTPLQRSLPTHKLFPSNLFLGVSSFNVDVQSRITGHAEVLTLKVGTKFSKH